jgi:hypothetical protein
MNSAAVMRNIAAYQTAAAVKSLRQMYPFNPNGDPLTLTDGALAAIFSAAIFSVAGAHHTSAVLDTRTADEEQFAAALPKEVQEYYHAMREHRWQFFSAGEAKFDRFVACIRSEVDGMLIGFANNDLYYVLATWDSAGHSLGPVVPK